MVGFPICSCLSRIGGLSECPILTADLQQNGRCIVNGTLALGVDCLPTPICRYSGIVCYFVRTAF